MFQFVQFLIATGHVIYRELLGMVVKTTLINVGTDYWKMKSPFETCGINYEALFPDVISRSWF